MIKLLAETIDALSYNPYFQAMRIEEQVAAIADTIAFCNSIHYKA